MPSSILRLKMLRRGDIGDGSGLAGEAAGLLVVPAAGEGTALLADTCAGIGSGGGMGFDLGVSLA